MNKRKLNGQGVCTKTQETFAKQNGMQSGKASRLAETWAEAMTKNYEQLSKAEPVFRELRNMMDMSVVAAIIAREKLLQQVGLDLPAINGLDTVSTPAWNVPQTVPTQCSYARISDGLIVTTSGGVTVDSWAVAAKTKTDSGLKEVARLASASSSDRWWWNAN